LGGEEAKAGDFEFYKKNFDPKAVFVNGLGPSECTLALQWFADQSTELIGGLVPAGLPVATTEVMLLDANLQESAVSGELLIASDYVTPGYWQQDELTEQAFIEMNDRRWYRTGDRARYLPDGNLVFAGRVDEQIKLRGHRIEPGEIEARLMAHECVDRAVVALRDDLQGNARLVAWVVAKKRHSVESIELRNYLKGRLPRYMMPSVISVQENLPLTPNGKVDRRALPAPKWGRNEDQLYIAPRNDTEEQLAAIWGDVLGLGRVGVNDDFFDLGGHSLLAMQLMARTTESLQVGLPLRRLFDGPTIAEVAQAIDDVRWTLTSAES
jgi:acyl-CoA synthetase (AMP-forming)/AMP-acid ligase II